MKRKRITAAVLAVVGVAALSACSSAGPEDVYSYCDKYGNLVYLFNGEDKGEAIAVIENEEGCRK